MYEAGTMPQNYISIRIHSGKASTLSPQPTQALYAVYWEATLYNVYILSVYTVHCVANVILNYTISFNMALN